MVREANNKNEARLLAFVEAVYDAFIDWNVATGALEMSGRMDLLLGMEPGALPRTYDGWLNRIHPADRARANAGVYTSAVTGEHYLDEYRMLHGSGEYIVVRDSGVIIEEDGQTHMIAAIRDITDAHRAEREQRRASCLYLALFAQAKNPAYHISEEGRFLDANPAGLSMLGVTRRVLLKSHVSTAWGQAAQANVREALSGSGLALQFNLDFSVKGSPRSMVVTLLPFAFEGEQTCFALGTDVTEHEALRHALEESEQSLQRQATALEDVNTALRVILDRRNEDRTAFEATISDNLQTLVMPLLERLRRQLNSAPERIYVEQVVDNLRELVRPLARSLDVLVADRERLTAREREIANFIRSGKSSDEIAQALFITPATVAFHRRNLRRKLGLEGGHSLATHLARCDLDCSHITDAGIASGDANKTS